MKISSILFCFILVNFLNSSLLVAGVNDYMEQNLVGKIHESDTYKLYKEKLKANVRLEGGLTPIKKKVLSKITVPGMLSSRPMNRIAKIIGPSNNGFFLGDRIFLSWLGAPGPKVGDVYSTYTPAIVLQNKEDPTDFIARPRPDNPEDLPKAFRLAGFMYDSTADIQITKISSGVVEARIINMTGTLSINDEIMLPMPRYEKINPIDGGLQLSAAIVSGSPYERINTMPGTFVYLNRGSRDGIKVGRVFEAAESIKFPNSSSTSSNTSSKQLLGEIMVVFVSDAFSTALITKQFDIIRIGSLLKSKQIGQDTVENFTLSTLDPHPISIAPQRYQPQVVPTPHKTPIPTTGGALSELDALEKNEEILGLSAQERARLEQLNAQESAPRNTGYAPISPEAPLNIQAPSSDSFQTDGSLSSSSNEAPSLPPPPSAFVQSKETAKKDDKKKKTKKKNRDEEELNQLMMQN